MNKSAITDHVTKENHVINRASAYGTPLDGATVKVVITTVNKT